MIIEGSRRREQPGTGSRTPAYSGDHDSIATSIDARGMGFSFAFLPADILVPAIIIGIRAFESSFAGVISGTGLKCFSGIRSN